MSSWRGSAGVSKMSMISDFFGKSKADETVLRFAKGK